jgi:2,5-diketo-D-gluconate reductase A
MAAVPTLPLSAGASTVDIPQLGLGVWQVPDEDTPAVVGAALGAGYRSIDTARIYGNEEGVGRALAATDLPRDELFVTTKVWNDDQGFEATLRAFEASAKRLGLEVVDLYLIHWPAPARERYVDTWRALLRLREEGRVRAVGVCNFQPEHLRRLADETGELPALNQVELHPYLQQQELRDFHAEHGIVTEAWSPLAARADGVSDPAVRAVAQRHGVTPAQAMLRWHVELGNVVIPKSLTPTRIAENIEVFGFGLTEEDHAQLAALDRGLRTGPHPDRFNG